MKLLHIDHLVITTQDLVACLHFYVDLLGMTHQNLHGHHNLLFGNSKISVHLTPGEFAPCAAHPAYGSQDFCLIVDDVEAALREIEQEGYPMVQGIVDRNGAKGPIRSLYLRDPDGNLVELSQYV